MLLDTFAKDRTSIASIAVNAIIAIKPLINVNILTVPTSTAIIDIIANALAIVIIPFTFIPPVILETIPNIIANESNNVINDVRAIKPRTSVAAGIMPSAQTTKDRTLIAILRRVIPFMLTVPPILLTIARAKTNTVSMPINIARRVIPEFAIPFGINPRSPTIKAKLKIAIDNRSMPFILIPSLFLPIWLSKKIISVTRPDRIKSLFSPVSNIMTGNTPRRATAPTSTSRAFEISNIPAPTLSIAFPAFPFANNPAKAANPPSTAIMIAKYPTPFQNNSGFIVDSRYIAPAINITAPANIKTRFAIGIGSLAVLFFRNSEKLLSIVVTVFTAL